MKRLLLLAFISFVVMPAAMSAQELDAATIYNIIENEIAAAFYDREETSGIPQQWCGYIKNTVAKVACNFTTNRMLTDYINQYYEPLCQRQALLNRDEIAIAREIAQWKKQMRNSWPYISVKSYDSLSEDKDQPMLGVDRELSIELNIGEVEPNDVGVELVCVEQDVKGRYHIKECFKFEFESSPEKGVAKYICKFVPTTTGVYYTATRIFAKNALLPHRQDFELVRWL